MYFFYINFNVLPIRHKPLMVPIVLLTVIKSTNKGDDRFILINNVYFRSIDLFFSINICSSYNYSLIFYFIIIIF